MRQREKDVFPYGLVFRLGAARKWNPETDGLPFSKLM